MSQPNLKEARIDARLVTISALLQLQEEARRAENGIELGYIAVNETHRLIPYHQAILWRYAVTGSARIEAVSGVSEIERNSPFINWLTQVIDHVAHMADARQAKSVEKESLPVRLHDGWNEWVPGFVFWSPFVDRNETMRGGLVLFRDKAFDEAELSLLERLSGAYAYSAAYLEAISRRTLFQMLRRILPGGFAKVIVLASLIGAMFIPLRLSVLAPAEIVARDPTVISSPVDGVIEKIHVKPNARVEKGELLFGLDDTSLASRLQVAQRELDVARADYLRAAQMAFSDLRSKAELARLNAVVEEKAAEVDYTTQLLDRILVRSDRNGIAIFADANDWVGRPVSVGERVMVVADPEASELQAWVPVGDALNLEPGAEVKLFLNIEPSKPIPLELYQTSFEAETTPDGNLAFRIKARFSENGDNPRIGLKGTAKIYGDEVVLAYWLLRKPLAAARQFLGL